MKEKDNKSAEVFMRAMEARRGASLTYSRNSEQAAIPRESADAPDTGVIKSLTPKTHKLETASQIADYILARRELLSDVFSQYKAGGEEFVQTFLIGRLSSKIGIKAVQLIKADTVKQILSMIRRRMKQAASG